VRYALTRRARKKKVEPDDPEQSARFIETAERIQAEEAEEKFEEAMKRISLEKKKDTKKDKHRD
jgi:hypothetical protein